MKKILFIYPCMIMGGSTTSLLALLNGLDSKEFEIDLQLQSNEGPLLEDVPKHVNILPPAQKYKGKIGRIFKVLKFVFSGAAFNAYRMNKKNKKRGFSNDIIFEFFAKSLSKKNEKRYDYAVSFLEGWANWYLAYQIHADKKYAWLHSTFANITDSPDLQIPWMERVDKIIFVTDACVQAFKETMPQMAGKTLAIENIIDSDIIKKRSDAFSETDCALKTFQEAKCFKIVTVCRITIETKGLDRIVSCAKKLKEDGKDFLWYIVGSGADDARLREMIVEAQVEDCLAPIGARLNPYPFIKAADIMCMPSRYEGKPMVITESMILGVPPVVTEYLSARLQIKDGLEGLVVENNDTAIIDAVFKCMQDRPFLAELKKYLSNHEYGNKSYIEGIKKNLF